MSETITVRFKLASIEDERCCISTDKSDFSNLSVDTLKFQYKTETIIQMSRNTILVRADIKYSHEKRELLSASAVFNYSVTGLGQAIIVDLENQCISVKADIFPSLLEVSYNSLRGMVYNQTAGTSLAQYPMPIVDTKELVAKNGITVEE